jgi:hypothetical protein
VWFIPLTGQLELGRPARAAALKTANSSAKVGQSITAAAEDRTLGNGRQPRSGCIQRQQPPLPGIYPDMMAPIIRQGAGERVMEMARWGVPTPPRYLRPGAIDRGVTRVSDNKNGRRPFILRFL